MTAASVARLGHRAYRSGRVVAITGLRNKIPAFAVRLTPRSLVRKIAKRFNALRDGS
jgi:short-subunit dehydrogenase